MFLNLTIVYSLRGDASFVNPFFKKFDCYFLAGQNFRPIWHLVVKNCNLVGKCPMFRPVFQALLLYVLMMHDGLFRTESCFMSKNKLSVKKQVMQFVP